MAQIPNLTFSAGGSHSRSLSQPPIFANNSLPPLSPFPPSETSLVSSNSNVKNASMEEQDVSSHGPVIVRDGIGLPPRRGHRRSNSDVPLGFSAVIRSSPQLVPISRQESLGNDKSIGIKRREMDPVSYGRRKSEGQVVEDMFDSLMNLDHVDDKDMDTIVSGAGTKISGGDSNSESESVSRNGTNSGERVKRSSHHRSLSMDSGIGNIYFSDSSPNLRTSSCNRVDQLSPCNSLSENLAKINLDFGHGEFNEFELKKIMADERLAEIATSDPKRAKRILANRQSAARSKERKMRYISELEHKVHTLQTETTTLSAQITLLQKDYAEINNLNNELKFRIQAMEQQAHLRDALHETLTAEVQRLKLAAMELREEGNAHPIPMNHHIFPMQRQQRLSVTASKNSSPASAAPTSA